MDDIKVVYNMSHCFNKVYDDVYICTPVYSNSTQDKIFRRKSLSTAANFVHVYLQIWDTGILKFNKFSM